MGATVASSGGQASRPMRFREALALTLLWGTNLWLAARAFEAPALPVLWGPPLVIAIALAGLSPLRLKMMLLGAVLVAALTLYVVYSHPLGDSIRRYGLVAFVTFSIACWGAALGAACGAVQEVLQRW